MKNINIGIANLILSNKLKETYFDNNLNEESKKNVSDFIQTIKNSEILQLEFKVFDNIENKYIENELLASKYIDNNIKLFEVYTINEIENEREKLKLFINEYSIPLDNDKVLLYNAIDNLIEESLTDYKNIDVDNIHESYTFILNHLMKRKESLIEENLEYVNEGIIEIAVDKFNQKYDKLTEDEIKLIRSLVTESDANKKELLETYKEQTINMLENVNNENVKENIKKAIQKIKEMKYDKSNVNDNIISLFELKKSLL